MDELEQLTLVKREEKIMLEFENDKFSFIYYGKRNYLISNEDENVIVHFNKYFDALVIEDYRNTDKNRLPYLFFGVKDSKPFFIKNTKNIIKLVKDISQNADIMLENCE